MPSFTFPFEQSEETMPVKPTANEEEYFARQEAERRRKLAGEVSDPAENGRAGARPNSSLHEVPECGLLLEEIAFAGVRVDKCFGCEGIWLDKGELATLQKKEPGFAGRMLSIFR